jgi:hypothetical protein
MMALCSGTVPGESELLVLFFQVKKCRDHDKASLPRTHTVAEAA